MPKTTLPSELSDVPIISAVFEIRFGADVTVPLGDLLPGLLFTDLSSRYPSLESMPFADVPRALRSQTPDYQYQAIRRLSGQTGAVMFADQSMVVEVIRPYPGWRVFSNQIMEVLASLKKYQQLLGTIRRCSLRYINVLSQEKFGDGLTPLKVALKIADFDLAASGMQLRVEIPHDTDLLSVLSLVTSAQAGLLGQNPDPSLYGLVVDVDTMRRNPPRFWENYPGILEKVHETGKTVFFSVLTEHTLTLLGPKS